MAADPYFSLAQLQEPEHQFDRCCLTGSVRAEKAEHFPAANRNIYVAQDLLFAKGF